MHGTSGSGNCKLRERRIDKWPYDKIRKSEGLAYDHSARIRFLDLKKLRKGDCSKNAVPKVFVCL